MSYILEALKKAQAERQLGATPDLHSPVIDTYAARGAARFGWLPAALGAAAAVVAIGLTMWWRDQPLAPPAMPAGAQSNAPAAPAVAAAGASPAPAQPAVAAQQPATAPAPAPVPAQVPVPVSAPVPAPVANATPATLDAPAPAASNGAAPAAQRGGVPAQASAMPAPAAPNGPALAGRHSSVPATAPAAPVRGGADASNAAAPVKLAAPPEPADESIPTARDLPEPIQRILPTVAMSGYMYSKNPADRLVLIDKALRREGDEVAPGLVLERLLPKGAVFTFRGYRYRVPY